MQPQPALHGLMAEFKDGADLLAAARASRSAGYSAVEAYSPLPMEDVSHALGHRTHLPWLVLAGGTLGALAGFGLQYWVSVLQYPLNIGGRPLNSWPSFVVVTFEMTVLFSALTAVFGMLALNGLPQPHHPVFNVDAFERASRNRFFLVIMATDPKFDASATRRFLEAQRVVSVAEVPL